MASRRSRDLTVGVMAALALAILSAAVMAVGDQSRIFVSKRNYMVNFPTSEGLVVGSPVKIAGVQVGTVAGIELPTDPSQSGISVEVGVERKYSNRVREDSYAALRILQLLSGEKYVDITPGSPDVPTLQPGATIPLLRETALLEQGEDIAQNLNEITSSLKELLTPIVRGEGLIGEMFQNPDFGKEGLEKLKGTLANLEALTASIRSGQGFVGRAIHDREFGERVDDLGRAIENFARLMDFLVTSETPLDERSSILGELLAEGGQLDAIVDDLEVTASALRGTAERLESPEGLVGRLLHDEVYSEQLADDLRTTLANLRQITDKINRGEGTLGALVNERVVHDGLEDVVAGVNDSKFARWLLRHYQKKGIKLDTREEPQP